MYNLEYLNAVINGNSWTKQDEIVYTKKLIFSNDESPRDIPIQERDRAAFTKTNNNSNSGNLYDQRRN